MILPHEEPEVRKCLDYLNKHLSPRAPTLTKEQGDFYLMGLRPCSLSGFKAACRAGVSRWRWMPKVADIIEIYREVTTGTSAYVPIVQTEDGCPECDGTGWRSVGVNTVSPCACPVGEKRRASRRRLA